MSLVTGSICAFISTTIGLVAGYFGGWVDEVLSLITNVFLVLGQLLMIIIAAYHSSGVVPIIVVSITGWAWERVLRSQMLTLKSATM